LIMKTEKEVRRKINELVYQLPDARAGMPAHLIRQKIKILQWVTD